MYASDVNYINNNMCEAVLANVCAKGNLEVQNNSVFTFFKLWLSSE